MRENNSAQRLSCFCTPVAFAGVIVSIRLARSRNAAASLGSNLLGSVVGGCLEYLSMVAGLRALALLALALYLAAFLAAQRQGATGAAVPVEAAPSLATEPFGGDGPAC